MAPFRHDIVSTKGREGQDNEQGARVIIPFVMKESLWRLLKIVFQLPALSLILQNSASCPAAASCRFGCRPGP